MKATKEFRAFRRLLYRLRKSGTKLPLAIPLSFAFVLQGCSRSAAPVQGAAAQHSLSVEVRAVLPGMVPINSTYIATIRSRRFAAVRPQVTGNITSILVHSGQYVQEGQLLLTIDPLRQQATVEQQEGTEAQKRAVLNFNQSDENRQKQLFANGLISRAAYDQALQGLENSKGDYASARAQTRTQQQELAYYQIRAPFAGTIADVPVHQGDLVDPSVVITTVNENGAYEAYISLPTDRLHQLHLGLPVELRDTDGNLIAQSSLDFLSPQIDDSAQTILVKAPVPRHAWADIRNQELLKARVTWEQKSEPLVPVLAVIRTGGQNFVYTAVHSGQGYKAHEAAVTLGEPIGDDYPVLSGLQPGEMVIVSGIQMLSEDAAIQPARVETN